MQFLIKIQKWLNLNGRKFLKGVYSLFSIDQQIEYLKNDKGISFFEMSEMEAKKKLKEISYYYKVTCFKRNFRKNKYGKYRNLDFATLYDLSVIDARLRQLVLKLSLDLEHEFKTDLLSFISEDSRENGFIIVTDFDRFERQKFYNIPSNSNRTYHHVQYLIMGNHHYDVHSYDRELVGTYLVPGRNKNHSTRPLPIYALMERMSYGKLNNFIDFYFSSGRHKSSYFANAQSLFIMTKRLRDAAAHNRPILQNVVSTSGRIGVVNILSTEVTNYLSSMNLLYPHNKFLLKNVRLHDLFCLLMLHTEYVKNPIVKEYRRRELKRLLTRIETNKHLYSNHSKLKEIFNFFKEVSIYF